MWHRRNSDMRQDINVKTLKEHLKCAAPQRRARNISSSDMNTEQAREWVCHGHIRLGRSSAAALWLALLVTSHKKQVFKPELPVYVE